MALSYPISKAVSVKSDEKDGVVTAIVEFRYVDFRLELDDPKKILELRGILDRALLPKDSPGERVVLPKFYKDRREEL